MGPAVEDPHGFLQPAPKPVPRFLVLLVQLALVCPAGCGRHPLCRCPEASRAWDVSGSETKGNINLLGFPRAWKEVHATPFDDNQVSDLRLLSVLKIIENNDNLCD